VTAAAKDAPAGAASEAAVRPEVRAVARTPEPGSFWVRWAPAAWPVRSLPWLDLARGGLGSGGRRPPDRVPRVAGGPFDDVLYLPPVAAGLAAERDDLACEHLARGTPVLVQVVPGDPPPPAGCTVVHDLLPALLDRDLDVLAVLPREAVCAWPLLAGLTDGPELVAAGLGALAAAGAAVVQPAVPRLDAADRRRLAEGWGEGRAFEALFHGPAPDDRALAAAVAERGMAVFAPRPLPRPPLGGAAARRLAGVLALVGELWLRTGRPPSQGQAFFRSARWIDESGYDAEALVREGNLGVVGAVDPASRAVLEDAVGRDGEPAVLAELLAEYCGGATASGGRRSGEGRAGEDGDPVR